MQPSTFYEQHFAFAWASLRRLGVASVDLEDVTHDVFVVVHRRRRELSRATSPRGWLFGIVRRVASNYRRGVWRHRRRMAAVRDVIPGATRPERELERTDAAHVVTRFLEGLAEPLREAFVLFELQQRTAREVAQILQINPNTASARLRAARKAFHQFAARVREENAFDQQRALIEARLEDGPPREAQQRVGSALAVSLGAPTKAAATSWALGAWAKVAAVTLALGGGTLGAITGVAWALHDPPPAEATAPPTLAAAHGSTAPQAPVVPPPREAPSVAEGPAPPLAPTLAPAIATPPGPPRALPSADPRERPSPSPEPVAGPATGPVDDVEVQTELLARARAALARDDAAETTRLAATYRERFAAGPFLAEIDLLEIRARCATADVAGARDLAVRFARSHPRSPHLLVISKTCAGSITKTTATGD